MHLGRASRNLFVCLGVALIAAALGHLLWSAWCAFTWFKYQLHDYGLYMNMMWNTAHGEPLRMLVDRSYFNNHLSFTMAAMGLGFWIWNHPFMPALMQWMTLVSGTVLVALVARRRGLPREAVVALSLLYVLHPFTQGAMLSELRGVNLYFALYPWLFYCACFAKSWTALPLALLLGTREDSLLMAVPLLLYVATRDRWRGGFVYAAVALAYGILALTVLFPLLSGQTLTDRRASGWSDKLAIVLNAPPRHLSGHLERLPWLLLPLATALFRGSSPVFVLPSLVYLLSLSMTYFLGNISGFRHHYGGVVLIALTLGILDAWARRLERPPRGGGTPDPSRSSVPWRALALAVIVVGLHLHAGFLSGGPKTDRFYKKVYPDGLAVLRASRHVPRDGILVVDRLYAAHFGNRRDMLDWRGFDPARHTPRAAFLPVAELGRVWTGQVAAALGAGEAGVRYYDGKFLVAEWGAPTNDNAFVLRAHAEPRMVLPFGRTQKHAGDDRAVSGAILARHWDGDGSRAPVTISYGAQRDLAAGSYRVRLRYRAEAPRRTVRDSWGRVSLHRAGAEDALVDLELEHVASPPGRFHVMELPLAVEETGPIEIRLLAGDAALWVDRAIIIRVDGESTP